jgi:hypothetical protein
MSKLASGLIFLLIETEAGVEIMMKPFESCNAQQPFPRTPKSIIMNM